MKKLPIILSLLLLTTICFSQLKRKVSIFASAKYGFTLHDPTRGTNDKSIGLGLQLFTHNPTKFKFLVDITGEVFGGLKVLYLDDLGRPLSSIEEMVNLFGGASFHPTDRIYFSVVGGPSFMNGETLFGIKPSAGFFFSKRQRVTARVSYVNIPDRIGDEDFGALVIGLGLRLF